MVEGATCLAKQQKESFFLSLPQSCFFFFLIYIYELDFIYWLQVPQEQSVLGNC